MPSEVKKRVDFDETFKKLDIRVGRVLEVSIEESAPKKSYKLIVDFGRFGKKQSVARLTQHSIENLKGKEILGILNIGNKRIGNVISEVLVLGVQYPKAESGEATFITPAVETKIGSKLF